MGKEISQYNDGFEYHCMSVVRPRRRRGVLEREGFNDLLRESGIMVVFHKGLSVLVFSIE